MRKKHAHRGRRFLFKLGLAAGFVVIPWIIGLFRFADAVPAGVVDATTRTDAIVVLTGGSRRLGEGLELLSRGLAEKLFVSGVYQGVEVRELLKVMKRRPGDLENLIGIGNATNTTGNAIETTVWMKKNEYLSLRLVTAAYHMPRSLLEFGHAMPGVTLIPHPVFPENVKRDRWWAWPGTASLMIGEYDKYLLAWSSHWVGSLLEKAGMTAGAGKGAAKAGV
ncbi:MAG: YdcF family protein [Proteobacteria bacterium]|nr:YdcF family protein [Pseudomonadota bacterium]